MFADRFVTVWRLKDGFKNLNSAGVIGYGTNENAPAHKSLPFIHHPSSFPLLLLVVVVPPLLFYIIFLWSSAWWMRLQGYRILSYSCPRKFDYPIININCNIALGLTTVSPEYHYWMHYYTKMNSNLLQL